MADYQRPPGFRFQFKGVNLRDSPDAINPSQYASGQNVRGYAAQAVRARPGGLSLRDFSVIFWSGTVRGAISIAMALHEFDALTRERGRAELRHEVEVARALLRDAVPAASADKPAAGASMVPRATSMVISSVGSASTARISSASNASVTMTGTVGKRRRTTSMSCIPPISGI